MAYRMVWVAAFKRESYDREGDEISNGHAAKTDLARSRESKDGLPKCCVHERFQTGSLLD